MLTYKPLALVSDSVREEHCAASRLAALNESATTTETDSTWRNAMLRRLLRRSGGGGSGTLYCHPSQRPGVTTWLNDHPHLGWGLQNDEALSRDVLKLLTEQGEMFFRWQPEPAVSRSRPAS